MSEQLTLYFHKVQLALAEANAPYRAYQVDLRNKPEWFTSKVNPVGQVPVVTYGGPNGEPDDPSSLSTKIAESNVILEFLADLYPDSGLLPKDPVLRAKGRDFAVGDHYTIADACISPHLARLKIVIETDIGNFPVGMGYKLGEELEGAKFAKFKKYVERMLDRPSFK
ncbi:hypothetical protein BDR07DRAFT_1375254 [Suillus spraguei]|nr:hypothetical protein BDR07DRAFT_1375254 [Suillus spraguei]